MAKMLTNKDFDMSNIGTRVELDEVIPRLGMDVLKDENGNEILDKDGKPKKFYTDEIIGYSYSVTIKDGEFKKKSTQIRVDHLDPLCTNDYIMEEDEILVGFENIQVTMIGNPMYYKADKIFFWDDKK